MPLFGREAELKDLGELVDGPAAGCGGVVVQGEAGVGKSALVAEAVAAATVGGLRVLRTTGVEAERNFAYAGLHQLLYPVRASVDTLPAPQRSALWTALGLAETAEPNAYLVGLAALTLLSEEAAVKPLLIVAEDVHWLDRESADVLAFVARRIESEPIVLIATLRDGEPSPLRDAGLSSMDLFPLPGDVAAELLDSVAPRLTTTVRARVLAEAAGNPLALSELPSAASRDDSVLPLTERLERTFGDRFTVLPEPARTTLLVAALDETGSVAETLAAAGALLGTGVGPEALALAAEARLIDLEPGTVTFRHPLMRSAIPASASSEERRHAHLALAETLRGQPDRRAWHQAAAATGADEEVAGRLEDAADRARHRGGTTAAIAALEQAARLSADPERRADRLLRAAELAVESGGRETAGRLVEDARAGELTPRQRSTASWLLSGFEDGLREDLSRVAELARLAESVAADGQPDPAMRILWGAAMRCFWSEPGPQTRRTLLAVADGLPIENSDPRLIAVAAYVAPFERAEAVLGGLRELAATTGTDPEVDRFLGSASLQIGAVDLAARFSAAAAPGLRAQGRLGLLPRALAVQAWSRVRLGDLAAAVPVAAEAAKFAKETGQPFMYGLATAVQAEIAALRGEHKQAKALADEAERAGLPAGARPVLATVQLARGIAASSEGRFDDAFADLRRLFDPADPAYQLALRVYFVAELAEAAIRAGQVEELREVVTEMEQLATPAPALQIGLRYARAVLDPSDELFETALSADLDGWPAERGRLHLAYGEWLRRQRRVVDSRAHLRTARETFDALGMTAWAERARRELRSAGESSPNRGPDAREKLTPHELSIVQLAAEGLTNREIGQRLYLSHRTVGTHLHRIFPKVGVTSRAELKKVVSDLGR
ncbi:helix-turn-helix transcriptional regulator [Amycolatopsis pittospori]|uniref:helix-turn-helix transcriptional regulator n=1 Tax=Amycolatopsis pittospori TaxID=2749434 RepID=UPI0015F0430A|nr:LuxR family transcriptional regulator [Amycolatopsis pittospori]